MRRWAVLTFDSLCGRWILRHGEGGVHFRGGGEGRAGMGCGGAVAEPITPAGPAGDLGRRQAVSARRLAGEEGVEDVAEGVEVGGGEGDVRWRGGAGFLRGRDGVGDAEVGDFEGDVGGEEEIGGLEVAVVNAEAVGMGHGLTGGAHPCEDARQRERAVAPHFERAGHEFHDHVVRAGGGIGAGVEQADDVRMGAFFQERRFVAEARGDFSIRAQVVGHDLEGDLGAGGGIERAKDAAHAAGAERIAVPLLTSKRISGPRWQDASYRAEAGFWARSPGVAGHSIAQSPFDARPES